tara:strand:+ start:2513 stop:2878 length:366 start_codon:yes stop_codon:yes gene_type:complete
MEDLRYFTFDEFDSPDYPGSGEKFMDREFVYCLDEARDIAGIQFKIISGYRTPQENLKSGGLSNSSHLIGRAADIHCTHIGKRLKIIEALSMVGFQRFGIAKDYIHVDNDDQKPNSIWLYS